MRKIITLVLLLGALACVTGCETLSGFATDMANTGNNIQDIVNGGPEFKSGVGSEQ